MIGGNSTGGGIGFGGVGGLFSPFNAAYNFATNSALQEAGFGAQLLNGVSNFVSGAAYGISGVVGSLNNTVGQLGAIADTVTLGYFSQTKFAKSLRKTQNQVSYGSRLLTGTANSLSLINGAVQRSSSFFGSLLDFPIG